MTPLPPLAEWTDEDLRKELYGGEVLIELLRRERKAERERCAALVDALWKPVMLSASARQLYVDPGQYAAAIRALS